MCDAIILSMILSVKLLMNISVYIQPRILLIYERFSNGNRHGIQHTIDSSVLIIDNHLEYLSMIPIAVALPGKPAEGILVLGISLC